MIYLLDTNAISDLMDDHPIFTSQFAARGVSHRLVTCPIVRGEILHGIERLAAGRRRDLLERTAGVVFTRMRCEPITEIAADRYSVLKVHTQRAGITLNENDLWIAATVLAFDATLITRDQDFHRVAGLQVEDWTK